MDGQLINCWGAVILSSAKRLLEECNFGEVKTVQVAHGDSCITIVPVRDEAVFVITHRILTEPDLIAEIIETVVTNLEYLI